MATGGEVLRMLCPAGGWVVYGDDFDSIIWDNDQPKCTKAEFTAGFANYDAWRSQQILSAEQAKAAAQAKLEALGLTTDDLKALGL